MNRRSSSSLNLSKAITGFLNFKMAEGLTSRSIESYERILNKWLEYVGDVEVKKISSQEISGYLTWLRTDYIPQRFSGKTHPLSPKTMRNIWITLSSFFTWAKKEFKVPDPMDDVPAPKFKTAPVEAYTKEEIERMIKACMYSREAGTNKRKKFVMRLANGYRDQAIILTLLDTGLRALELCSLKIQDVDTKTGKIVVEHGIEGGAKGGQGRFVYIGKAARHAIWRYLADREDGDDPEAPLFTTNTNKALRPDILRHQIKRIGEKAGVKNAYPHKFRHTFAITYLRSGGDIFTLQILLNHHSLDMVRHYANLAEMDVEKTHRHASPVDNWHL